MSQLLPYIVLFRDDLSQKCADPPLAFECEAEDDDHAEEQCVDAYPDGEVVWVWAGKSVEDAYSDYRGIEA